MTTDHRGLTDRLVERERRRRDRTRDTRIELVIVLVGSLAILAWGFFLRG